jgi:hypothetical protein
MIRLREEVAVFGRLAGFGLIVGAIYWFVAYEAAGTVLLLGFGIASAVVTAVLWARSRHLRVQAAGGESDGDAGAGPFSDEPDRIPAPAYAPLIVGIGAGVVALGLAFGP